MDGCVHRAALRAPTFMLSANCHRTLFGRLFFDGIPIVRNGDPEDLSRNLAALELGMQILRQGGELDMFPEGSSSLGPKHLPFKSGAARILSSFLEEGGAIVVLPVGLHYQRAWAFRSKVEVVIGNPISTILEQGRSPRHHLRTLRLRIQEALESVGLNVTDTAEQDLVERLAYLATFGSKRSYSETLMAFQISMPEVIRQAWTDLENSIRGKRVLRHQGVPLVPPRLPILDALGLLVVGPVIPTAMLMNLPPFLAAWWAGKKLATGANHIALFRMLAGLAALTVWGCGVIAGAWWLGKPEWIAVWGLATVAGIRTWHWAKRAVVLIHNAAMGPVLKARMLALGGLLARHLAELDRTAS